MVKANSDFAQPALLLVPVLCIAFAHLYGQADLDALRIHLWIRHTYSRYLLDRFAENVPHYDQRKGAAERLFHRLPWPFSWITEAGRLVLRLAINSYVPLGFVVACANVAAYSMYFGKSDPFGIQNGLLGHFNVELWQTLVQTLIDSEKVSLWVFAVGTIWSTLAIIGPGIGKLVLRASAKAVDAIDWSPSHRVGQTSRSLAAKLEIARRAPS